MGDEAGAGLDAVLGQIGEMTAWIDDVVWRSVTGDSNELDDVIAQLDERIEHFGNEPKLDIRDDLWTAAMHNARAALYLERFSELGVLGDLDRALDDSRAVFHSCWSTEVAVLPDGQLALYNANRGRALSDHYDVVQTPELLDEAITHLRAAVELSPREPLYLALLGIAHAERYDGPLFAERDDGDLDTGIDRLDTAIALLPDSDVNRAPWLGSLARMLVRRFDARHNAEDLTVAIAKADEAVGAAASDQDRVAPLLTKARAARKRSEVTTSGDDVAIGIDALERALALSEQRPSRFTLEAAQFGLRWALRRGEAGAALDAARHGSAALLALRDRQARRGDVDVWLRNAVGLAADTAWAHVLDGDAAAAAVTLERSRATMLSELLPDLSELRSQSVDTLAELREVLAALANERLPDRELLTLRRRRRELISGLRQATGGPAEEELSSSDLQRIATSAPLCYLASSIEGPFAVVVEADGARVIRFDDGDSRSGVDEIASFWRDVLSAPSAVRAREVPSERDVGGDDPTRHGSTREDAIARIVEWLGSVIVGPLAQEVAGPAVVVATGQWAGLPIDAIAGAAAGWSQAPSARVLDSARRRVARTPGRRLLAVTEPEHHRTPPLPGARAEVAEIVAMYAEAEVLSGEQANERNVLAALAAADVVHIACHGVGDVHEPLRSGLLLTGDERLDVQDLIEHVALDGVRVAVLSACHTAVSGLRLPDEAVSLATGMLFSGAAGVVASLWAVPDAATQQLMVEMHRRWLSDGGAPLDALRGAQDAMRNGDLGDGRWRHPVNWAGFSYLGA